MLLRVIAIFFCFALAGDHLVTAQPPARLGAIESERGFLGSIIKDELNGIGSALSLNDAEVNILFDEFTDIRRSAPQKYRSRDTVQRRRKLHIIFLHDSEGRSDPHYWVRQFEQVTLQISVLPLAAPKGEGISVIIHDVFSDQGLLEASRTSRLGDGVRPIK